MLGLACHAECSLHLDDGPHRFFWSASTHLPRLQFENGDVVSRSLVFRTAHLHIRVSALLFCDAEGQAADIFDRQAVR